MSEISFTFGFTTLLDGAAIRVAKQSRCVGKLKISVAILPTLLMML